MKLRAGTPARTQPCSQSHRFHITQARTQDPPTIYTQPPKHQKPQGPSPKFQECRTPQSSRSLRGPAPQLSTPMAPRHQKLQRPSLAPESPKAPEASEAQRFHLSPQTWAESSPGTISLREQAVPSHKHIKAISFSERPKAPKAPSASEGWGWGWSVLPHRGPHTPPTFSKKLGGVWGGFASLSLLRFFPKHSQEQVAPGSL